jgi:hypothetical protein
MMVRCYNTRSDDYPDYGGRGIAVCDRWRESFAAFLSDMGLRPSRRHSLDRKDNAGGYGPDNCRWATDVEQANNRRSSRVITINGEARTLAQWAEHAGLKYHTLKQRLKTLTPEEAISRPVQWWKGRRKSAA